MNILILHSTSDLYGASRILLFTVQNLIDHGHKAVVVLSEEGPLSARLREAGAEVSIIRLGVLRRKYMSPKGMFNRLKVMTAAAGPLRRLIKEHQITVVYTNTTSVLIGAVLARVLGIRHIWHVHEIITSPKPFLRFTGFMVNRLSSKVIVVSDAVKQHWQKLISARKLVRIHNGIDAGRFQSRESLRHELALPEGSVVLGTIGRIHPWKGQDYFLKIAGELNRKFDNLYFVLAGDVYPGNEYLYEKLNTIIGEQGLEGRVFNVGYREDITPVLNALDIFVLPSILPDPLPTVVLEAMAAGKPVVATDLGGAREMVDNGTTGILVPLDYAAGAAQRMHDLVSDSDLRRQMGEKGMQRVKEHFSLETFNKAMITLLE